MSYFPGIQIAANVGRNVSRKFMPYQKLSCPKCRELIFIPEIMGIYFLYAHETCTTLQDCQDLIFLLLLSPNFGWFSWLSEAEGDKLWPCIN